MSAILIADDRESSRELLRAVLEHMGHAVLEAENGCAAVSMAQQILPDLIILDLRMPLLDGFDTLQALRLDSRLSHVPVVVLTASAMKGEEEAIRTAGFNGYMTKPISVSEIREVVNRFVRAASTTNTEIAREGLR